MKIIKSLCTWISVIKNWFSSMKMEWLKSSVCVCKKEANYSRYKIKLQQLRFQRRVYNVSSNLCSQRRYIKRRKKFVSLNPYNITIFFNKKLRKIVLIWGLLYSTHIFKSLLQMFAILNWTTIVWRGLLNSWMCLKCWGFKLLEYLRALL